MGPLIKDEVEAMSIDEFLRHYERVAGLLALAQVAGTQTQVLSDNLVLLREENRKCLEAAANAKNGHKQSVLRPIYDPMKVKRGPIDR